MSQKICLCQGGISPCLCLALPKLIGGVQWLKARLEVPQVWNNQEPKTILKTSHAHIAPYHNFKICHSSVQLLVVYKLWEHGKCPFSLSVWHLQNEKAKFRFSAHICDHYIMKCINIAKDRLLPASCSSPAFSIKFVCIRCSQNTSSLRDVWPGSQSCCMPFRTPVLFLAADLYPVVFRGMPDHNFST